MKYHPGELDQRVQITRKVRTPDGVGGDTIVVEVVDTVWCKVRPLSVRERSQYDVLNAESSQLFVIRYRDDVDGTNNIVWLGLSYNIRGTLDRGGRKLYLEIRADAGVAQ